MLEREYRLVFYTSMQELDDGDYDVGEYFDSYPAARSAAKVARMELCQRGFRVQIETQEVEMENGEAVEHYGWCRVVG